MDLSKKPGQSQKIVIIHNSYIIIRKAITNFNFLEILDISARSMYSDIVTESSHSWSSAHAWKACVSQGTEGSNPSLSAISKKQLSGCFFVIHRRKDGQVIGVML